MKPTKSKFKFIQSAAEDHKQTIFSVQFSPFATYDLFASVGSNRITIYKIVDGQIDPVLCFADPMADENYYCCAWAVDDNEQVVLAAGAHGIIRSISPYPPLKIKYLSGHGGAINDLKVSPRSPELALSASKDHSLRLWNITSEVCIAIFGGVEGHRDQVLSADFHLSGSRIISCGMDHALKIWNLDQELIDAIELSASFNDMIEERSFPTVRKHFPTFSTRDIHENYVDCVSWYGDTILSKSCQKKNHLVQWRPGKSPNESSLPQKYTTDSTATIIKKIPVENCELWFVKFSLDKEGRFLALGNTQGKIYLLDFQNNSRCVLAIPKCQSTIRQTCFNNDGSILMCCCDDGTIWRWDNVSGD